VALIERRGSLVMELASNDNRDIFVLESFFAKVPYREEVISDDELDLNIIFGG
jgi:hypothetical protein